MARINIKLEIPNNYNMYFCTFIIRFINIMIIDYRQYYIVLFIFISINIFAVCTLFAYKCQ